MEMSASEIVDGGHIIEGLWEFSTLNIHYLTPATNAENEKLLSFYEDVYYNDARLLVWDAGHKYSNFTFEYLFAQRYRRSEDQGD